MLNEKIIFNNPNRPVRTSIGTHDKPIHLCNMHFHSELEFLYLVHGGFICHTNDKTFTLNESDVLFLNSKVPHYTETTQPCTTCAFIQFRNPTSFEGPLAYLPRFINQYDTKNYIFKSGTEENTEIINYISALLKEKENKDISYDYYVTANIYLITSLLHRKKLLPVPDTLTDKKSLKKIIPVLEYIAENYSEQINLAGLCHIANLTESYLCRLFKKATGGTIVDYINFVRICNAEKLLKTNMSISEIAYNTGFSSLSYFNRIFRQYNQCSPSDYRRMSRQDDGMMLSDVSGT